MKASVHPQKTLRKKHFIPTRRKTERMIAMRVNKRRVRGRRELVKGDIENKRRAN